MSSHTRRVQAPFNSLRAKVDHRMVSPIPSPNFSAVADVGPSFASHLPSCGSKGSFSCDFLQSLPRVEISAQFLGDTGITFRSFRSIENGGSPYYFFSSPEKVPSPFVFSSPVGLPFVTSARASM